MQEALHPLVALGRLRACRRGHAPSADWRAVGHSAPPVPLPPQDLSYPAPPPIDRPRLSSARTYLVVAVVLVALVGGWYYYTIVHQPSPTSVVLVPSGTRIDMTPSGHAYFGPENLSRNDTWTISGSFVVSHASPASYCVLSPAQLSVWQAAGYTYAGCQSGNFGGGPISFSQTFVGAVCYVAWVNGNSSVNNTVVVTTAITATLSG